MKKIVCFDLDGVIVKEHLQFSTRLIKKQGEEIRPAIEEFFSQHFKAVMVGKSSLIDVLTPYLARFNWQGNVQSLLDFWFDGEKDPIMANLKLARSVKDFGVPTFVVTYNPAERVAALWPELLKSSFTGRYVSGETGFKKKDPALWAKIAEDNQTTSKNIFSQMMTRKILRLLEGWVCKVISTLVLRN